jgi:TonB family protein
VTAVASSTPAHDPLRTPPPGDAFGRFALTAKPLLALTQDQQLLATLHKVTNSAHEVCAAGSEIDFSTALLAHHAGVALLDCAAIATPIAQLTERLQAQFPDLVLIVAGSIEEQGMLAAHITDGSVHRFLHKPFSEQRVRLFVEAAWRRHAEAHAAPRPATTRQAAAPGRARWWWAALVAGAVIAAALVWIGTYAPEPHSRPGPAPAPPSAGRAGGTDAALESLLSRADRALGAGELTAPAGASAADLYREALRANAHEPRALNGIEQVITQLVSAAEARLQQGQLDAAQQLADQAHSVSADHPRVAFLLAQIAAQREHALLDKAQRDGLAQKQLDARVADDLSRAREALQAGHLIAPPEDNARFYIEAARALSANDALVQQAAADLSARLLSEARQALAAKNPEAADTWAAAAGDAGANPADVAALHQQAQQLRASARADSLAGLAVAFNERLAAGHIDEPATDSAKFYLAQLLQTDPAQPAAQLARTAYAQRVLDEARDALKAQDFAAARRWLAEARAADAQGAALDMLAAAVGAAEDEAQQANTYVNESTLTRTHYVAPQFPEDARLRGVEGWVELHFIVGTDGAVSELSVVGTQPVGVFELAALDAVRRWHYQPVVRGGDTVTQRARVRVRFTVKR